MSIVLRSAGPQERAALEELQRRASLTWEEHRAYLLANPDVIELPLAQLCEGRVRVAELDGEVAGFAALLPRGGVCELDGLFVEPRAWGRGVGRALVGDAVARARAQGATAIETVANPRAQGFYGRLDFIVIGQAQTPFGIANRMRIPVFPAQT